MMRLPPFTYLAPVSVGDAVKLMADHGPENSPGANTICMHGPQWTTLASLQFHPARRLVRVAFGPTCQAAFCDFEL